MLTPREYQQKIFETAAKKNTLVVLPTGLGKTLIALLLAKERMNKFPEQKIVFLAPTRPLVEQHFSYFTKNLENEEPVLRLNRYFTDYYKYVDMNDCVNLYDDYKNSNSLP